MTFLGMTSELTINIMYEFSINVPIIVILERFSRVEACNGIMG